ncbi:MAG: proline dehydrogenase family protein [Gemmatimonadales bacterium]
MESAVAAAKTLNSRNIEVSLDLLGESVHVPEETYRARDDVLDVLDAIAASGVVGNVSVKLTQLGLDIDRALCVENMRAILTRASEHGIFVRIDMESSAYTERTLDVFTHDLHPEFGELTGVVIQGYLRRSGGDVERMISLGARVRLCKGAYAEPVSVAFGTRQEVDASYLTLMKRLLTDGKYPAIATHDERLIDQALEFVECHNVSPDRFEFQMLYGVRRDLQQALREKGYNVRVYVPFGNNWYPYLMRRLAERPANVVFMVASMTKERLSRTR